MKTCLNCESTIDGQFCRNCGQKASTQKINWNTFLAELPQSLFNLEKGFWYTVKELSLRTQKSLDGYLAGKRVQFFKPIQYAILGITLYILLQAINPMNPPAIAELKNNNGLYDSGYAFGRIIKENLKFYWLLGIVLYALPAKLLFGKYNFTEHMVISAYVLGHTALLAVLSLPFLSTPIMFNPVIYLLMGILYFRIFKDPVNPLGTFAAVLGHLLLCVILFFLIPIIKYNVFNG